jgi:tagaturonate reductase
MKRLSYNTLKEQSYNGYLLENAPERVFQFGEGNFLRGFVNPFIDVMNEKANFNSKVILCQPIEHGLANMINQQDGLYTLLLRGFHNNEQVNDKRLISCVSRCLNPYENYHEVLDCANNPDLRFITCNTTEAGITYDPSCKFEDTPASSFPGKLTQFLFRRYQVFGQTTGKGFIILPCELIDNNGIELEKCVLQYAHQWNLGEDFIKKQKKENAFCSTLVDRIVTGYPKSEAPEICKELNYQDDLLVAGEVFGFWVIEGPDWIKEELPVTEANLPILITNDHKPYKERKVRILNGAHTSFVLGAYLAGQNIVRECMDDPIICGFMNKTINEEIIPTLNLPTEELVEFAHTVTERFKNPFIDHELLAISLNSTSKWRARLLPSLKEYLKQKNTLPPCITASFSFYIAFYSGYELTDQGLKARRVQNQYLIKDDPFILEFFENHKDSNHKELVGAVCKNQEFWGEDLRELSGFEDAVLDTFTAIKNDGAYEVMRKLLNS